MLLRRREQVFYGWWIVAIGAVITCVGSIYFYGSSVFFLPRSRELGLSRTAISVIFSTARLEGSVVGPFIGWATDKVGPQKMVVAGALITTLGFFALATVHSFWTLFLVFTGVLSVGFNMGFFPAMVVAANNWFVHHRTLAISILAASFRLVLRY